MATAEATGTDGGLESGVVAGLAILGIGLAGLAGAFVVAVARRRTARSHSDRTRG